MNEKQLKKLISKQDEAIGKAIKIHVNGKIDKLHEKIDNYIIEDNKWKEEAQRYREEKLEPIVETTSNLAWGGRFMKGSLGFIVLVGTAIAVVMKLI
jgi:hypothetical protein